MNKTTNSIKLLRSVMLLLVTMLTLSAQTARAEVSLVASPAAGGNINFDPNNSNYVIVTPNYGYIVDRVEMSFEYNSQPYTNELAQVGEKYRIDMPMGVTDVTVTAYFRLDTNLSFTITFESNGGDGGSMDAVTHTSISYTIPTCDYTKSNNMFIGWATSANGNVEYQPGDCITLTSNLTLFAKWVALSGTTSNGLNWSVAKSGTDFYELTISGNGVLESFNELNSYQTLIKSIVIGDGITEIENNVFSFFSNVTSLVLGNGVQTIGKQAFINLSSLTSLVIPNSVRTIEEHAFYRLSNLTSLVLGNGVQIIKESAFAELSNLTSDIIIPASVSTIGYSAFNGIAYNTANGISITAADGSQLTSIGPQAFSGAAKATIDLSKCTLLESIGGEQTFTGSKDVILPSSINSIAQYAFGKVGIFSGEHAYITVPAGKVLSVGSDKGVIADNGKADLIRFLFNNPASRGTSNALTLAMNNLSDWEGQTRSVTLERTFPAGKKQTVCLPFDPSALLSLGTVWAFTGIENGKAVMTQQTGSLQANTPYIFEATNEVTSITFSDVAISIGADPQSAGSGFTFHGTYEQKVWEADDPVVTGSGTNTRIYGFMMSDNDGQAVGQFVKARRRTVLRPFSCWLEYNGELSGTQTSQAPLRSATSELPDVIEILWVGADGTTETTGVIDTRTGTLSDDDAWYDLFGRKLNGKPTKPGLYINNGKKVHM